MRKETQVQWYHFQQDWSTDTLRVDFQSFQQNLLSFRLRALSCCNSKLLMHFYAPQPLKFNRSSFSAQKLYLLIRTILLKVPTGNRVVFQLLAQLYSNSLIADFELVLSFLDFGQKKFDFSLTMLRHSIFMSVSKAREKIMLSLCLSLSLSHTHTCSPFLSLEVTDP